LPSLPSPTSYFLAITAPFTPAFGIFFEFAFTHKSLSMSDLQCKVKE
jgi:hypothetical protein